MSYHLLKDFYDHIAPMLAGYKIRYYRWLDEDLNGKGKVALFRMSGSQGVSNFLVQYPDISFSLLADANAVVEADQLLLEIKRFLRSDAGFTSAAIENFEPLTQIGPTYLQNGRARFELVVRCMVEDH